MERVVPTIFALDKETLERKFNILKFSKSVHLDICDSKFVETKTINLDDCIGLRNRGQKIEIHLMVEEPLKYLDDCIRIGGKEVFIHREIFDDIEDFITIKNKFQSKEVKVNLVLNPKTLISDSISFLSLIDKVMLMSVEPGAEGQTFLKEVLNKVREIKVLNPNIKIQIDGGINLETSLSAFERGIDIISVGSFISSSNEAKKRYDLLNKI